MRHMKLLFLLPLILTTGCVIHVGNDGSDEDDWKARQRKNERAIQVLEIGRTSSSIMSELGDPDFIDSFRRDDKEFRVLYYRTHRTRDDGRTTRDETTPLVFVDGVLVGWGESAIDHATAP